ncbi:DNA adenine methylase [Psychrobacter sp. 2Y5]|uniref:DNA adenine methylase n=1 Tax=unclassified Psychrobacter TaxID=196806 RepID=UPI003F471773
MIIENADAYHIIGQHDRSDTLFYLDPPYTLDTRTNKDSYGKFEMDEFEHERLLELTLKSKGMFVISGYDNELYNDKLVGWTKSLRQTAISSRHGSTKRTEVLWISPNCEQVQPDIFGDIA